MDSCPECHSALVVNSAGEVVCSACGLVVEDRCVSVSVADNNRYLADGKRMISESTSTIVPGSFVQMDHANRMLSISNVRVLGAQSTLLRGVELIKQVCRGLGLNKNVEKRAVFLLRTSLGEMRRRLNLTVSSAAGAAILFAIRENNIPVSFKEVYSSIKNKGKRVTASKMMKAYRVIEEIMGEAPQRMRPEMFVTRVVNVLSNHFRADQLLKQHILSEIIDEANRCLSAVPSQAISGKNPYVLASSVVYHVVFGKEKFRRRLIISSTAEYAKIVGVTEYSIKENAKILSKYSASS